MKPWERYQQTTGAREPLTGPWSQFQQPAAPPPAAPPSDPSAGGGTLQFGPLDTGIPISESVNRALAGAGKALVDTLRGFGQMGELAGRAPSLEPGMTAAEIAAESDKAAVLAGQASQPTSPLQAEINESRVLDAPLMATPEGAVGNIGGQIVAAVPAAAVPGVNTYTGATVLGSALAALQPIAEGESRAENMALGAAGGAAGKAIVSGASRVLAPKTSQAARTALDEGVPLTPGQVTGGVLKRVEEGAKSIPVVGDFIRTAERGAIEGWNKAALQRVVKPIGGKVTKIGREGLEEARTKVSAAYEKLLPNLSMKVDGKLQGDIGSILQAADTLPMVRKEQLVQILRSRLVEKLVPKGKIGAISGKTIKEIDSDIGRLARDYMGSADVEQRHLGEALNSARQALRDAVQRSNPDFKSELSRIDKAYSMLLRVENAGARAGAHDGVFSPAQLKAASRQMDKSLRKKDFAQGKAGMQEFAEQGQDVLGSVVPDSGTPFRLGNALMLGGGYAIDPALATGMAAGSAAYSPVGRKALEVMLARRPELIRQAGNALAPLGSLGGISGSTLTTSSNLP